MHRPEVREETKPEQQMCHVFVGGIVQRCYYSIAQLNIVAQYLRPSLHVPLFVWGAEGHFSERRMTNYCQALFQNLNQTQKVANRLKSWQKP